MFASWCRVALRVGCCMLYVDVCLFVVCLVADCCLLLCVGIVCCLLLRCA